MKTILIAVLVLVVLGVGYYWGTQDEVVDEPKIESTTVHQKSSIAWRFEDAGESDNIPHTRVIAVVNNVPYDMGEFQGSCSEVGASGGIDGTGLLAGELSAVQCWFAGGGDEIGVFAHEDGGFDIMVGGLSESIEGSEPFRGDFEVRHTITP